MVNIDRFVILPIVRCLFCKCDVAEVDERGWCRGCVRLIDDG